MQVKAAQHTFGRLVVGAALLLAAACSSSGSVHGRVSSQLDLGVDAARRGYWQEALLRFENANAIEPHSPHVLNNLAVAYEAVGRFDAARTTYEAGLAIAPDDRNLNRNYNLFKDFAASNLKKSKPKNEAGTAKEGATDAKKNS